MQTFEKKAILLVSLVVLLSILSSSFGQVDLSDRDKVKAYVDSIRENSKTWLGLDPNASGFPNCRVCTKEYNQLSPPEQKFWTEMSKLNLKPEERLELQRKLYDVLMYQHLAIESEDLETNSRFTGLDKGKQKEHTKHLNDQVDKSLNEIPTSAHELLEFYLNDSQLDKEEVDEKIHSIFVKLTSVPGWQAFEARIPEETFEESQIRTSKSFEANPNLIENITKSNAKDEL